MRISWLAAFVALSGCLNPDQILPIHGVVTSIDPVQGQVVRLLRHSQEVGQQVYVPCNPGKGQPFKEAFADSEGRYAFELLRGETTSFTGFVSFCFRVETTFPSGSTAWMDLDGIPTELPLSPLRDWRPLLSVDAGVLQFEPVIPLPVEVPFVSDGPDGPKFTVALNHHAELTTTDGAVVWEADDRFQVFDGGANYRETLPLEAAHLEDFSGTLTLEAELFDYTVIPFGISGFQLPPVQMRGLPLSLAGATVPLSRGLPCTGFATPCPLTDGELALVDAGFLEELTLTLARPAVLRTIVLRQATEAFRLRPVQSTAPRIAAVITIEDGGTLAVEDASKSPARRPRYSPPEYVLTPDGGPSVLRTRFIAINVDAGGPAVSVRLFFGDGLVTITEVSLFE